MIQIGEWSNIFDQLDQSGAFPAVTIMFQTLHAGTTHLNWVYEMNYQGPFSAAGTVEILPAPVPEPSTMLMVLAGAPWVVARMRRHSRQRLPRR